MSKNYVYGFNVIGTIAREAPHRLIQVFMDKKRSDRRVVDLQALLSRNGLSWQPISAERLVGLAEDENHQGIVAEVSVAPVLDEKQLFNHLRGAENPFVCVLESIQDPRNLGACLRTAEAAGVDVVILPRHEACGITPVVRKAAAGAAEVLPLARVANIVRVLNKLRQDLGVWVVGADSGAEQSLYAVGLTGPLAMVFGSEGTGLRRLTSESCDHVAAVPMPGRAESLNVSVAVGVALFEAVRQRTPQV